MSFVIAAPEVMAAAATDLANIGSSISAASAAAAGPTMGILAAGADEVSVAISALFGSHAQGYQTLSAQLAAYHNQFVRALNAGAGSYASAEAANVQQTLLNAINAPTQTLLGRTPCWCTRSTCDSRRLSRHGGRLCAPDRSQHPTLHAGAFGAGVGGADTVLVHPFDVRFPAAFPARRPALRAGSLATPNCCF